MRKPLIFLIVTETIAIVSSCFLTKGLSNRKKARASIKQAVNLQEIEKSRI